MRLLHLADLHLGRALHGFSLAEEQRAFLRDVLSYADSRRPDAVVLAGDIYDRSVPPVEAVRDLSAFLTALSKQNILVLMVAGNHDSPERLHYASGILQKQGIYVAGEPETPVMTVVLRDAHGPVRFVLLPFVRPVQARELLPGAEILTYSDAVRALLETIPAEPGMRSVLITHQFVTAGERSPETSESESPWVGGTASVDAGLFDHFCYVALGHLHTAQPMGRESVRYAGAPLVYSVGEAGRVKTMTEVDIGEDGQASVTLLPITPLRAVRSVTGDFAALLREGLPETEANPEGAASCGEEHMPEAAMPGGRGGAPRTEDYVHFKLTDSAPIADAVAALRGIYPRFLSLEYTSWGSAPEPSAPSLQVVRESTLPALFDAFAESGYGAALEDEERAIVRALWEELS